MPVLHGIANPFFTCTTRRAIGSRRLPFQAVRVRRALPLIAIAVLTRNHRHVATRIIRASNPGARRAMPNASLQRTRYARR